MNGVQVVRVGNGSGQMTTDPGCVEVGKYPEAKIVKILKDLEKHWPSGLALDSIGGLILQRRSAGQMCQEGEEIESFPRIHSDGGGY